MTCDLQIFIEYLRTCILKTPPNYHKPPNTNRTKTQTAPLLRMGLPAKNLIILFSSAHTQHDGVTKGIIAASLYVWSRNRQKLLISVLGFIECSIRCLQEAEKAENKARLRLD